MATAKKAAPAAKKTPAAKKLAPAAAKKAAKLEVTDKSVPAAKPQFKFPATLPACADLYIQLQDERLELQRKADKLQEHETALKQHLINNLPISEATGVAGKLARVQVVQKERVQVLNFDEVFAYAFKHRLKGGLALIQKRVNDTAVKELLADPKSKFTGADLVPYKSLSVSRIK